MIVFAGHDARPGADGKPGDRIKGFMVDTQVVLAESGSFLDSIGLVS